MCPIGPHPISACSCAASIKCLLHPPAPVPDALPCLPPPRRESVSAERHGKQRGGQNKDKRKHRWDAVEEKHTGGGGGSACHVPLPSGPSHAENLSAELMYTKKQVWCFSHPPTSTLVKATRSCATQQQQSFGIQSRFLWLKDRNVSPAYVPSPRHPHTIHLGNEYGN